MKREKKSLVLTGLIVFILSVGVSTTIFGVEQNHGGGVDPASRQSADKSGSLGKFDALIKAISQLSGRLIVKPQDNGESQPIELSIENGNKLIKAVKAMKEYRELLFKCGIKDKDASAEALGGFLDDFIGFLAENLSKPEGLSEKELVTYVNQFEQFIHKKKELFNEEAKSFSAKDAKFLASVKQFAEIVLNGLKKDAVGQDAEDPIIKKMQGITLVLEQMKDEEKKVCSLIQKEKEQGGGISGKSDAEKVDKADKKDDGLGKDKDKDKNAKDKNKPKIPKEPVPPQVDEPKGDEKRLPEITPTPTPAPGQNIDDLLSNLLKRLTAKEPKKEEPKNEELDELKDLLKAAKDLADKLDKKEEPKKDEEKNPLEDLLKGLGEPKKGSGQQPSGSGSGGGQPSGGGGDKGGEPKMPMPQEKDDGEEQPMPQQQSQMPMLPQMPSNSQQPIVPEKDRRFGDDLGDKRRQEAPPTDDTAKGLLDLARIQSQIMAAQQQAIMGNPMNVNATANRLNGAGRAPIVPRRGPVMGGGTIANSGGVQAAPVQGARSQAVPSLLTRGSLSK